jgi:hypothetical protein
MKKHIKVKSVLKSEMWVAADGIEFPDVACYTVQTLTDLRVKWVTGVWFLQGATSFTPLSCPQILYGLSKSICVPHFNIKVKHLFVLFSAITSYYCEGLHAFNFSDQVS